jgi:predicted TIM-barrel fold metal-dependent hydrolase
MYLKRRNFIRVAAGGAVGSLLHSDLAPAFAQSSQGKLPRAKKIDFHCHAFPANALRALSKYYPDVIKLKEDPDGTLFAIFGDVAHRAWDHALRIRDIDDEGVSLELLSCPPVYTSLDDHLPEICRLVNDTLADSCRRDPDRFRAFAHLPFNDINAALKEMSRCLDQLGFIGIFITSNMGGHYPDSPQFDPFWEEANRRRVPVFLHPILSSCYHDSEKPPLLSFPFDTTLAAERLVTRGLYDRFPDVVLIVAHLGGTLPYLARRVDLGFEVPALASPGWKLSRPPSEYMKKLYVDTAMGWNRGAFNCARDLVGIEHMVFGTDYFIRGSRFMQRTIEFLDSLDITSSEREMVYHQNGTRILAHGCSA